MDKPRKIREARRAAVGMGVFLLAVAVMAALLLANLTPAGCRDGELTPVPETGFEARAAQTAALEGEEAEKIVCLTFDDGPSAVTPQVLDVLAEEGVPATFFVMAAENNSAFLPLVEREVEEGNQVALHTASHEYRQIYADTGAYWQDIKHLRAALAKYLDVDSIHYLRFPGGSTNTVSHKYGGSDIMKRLKAQAQEMGYRYIDWNVCAEDAVGGHPSADTIFHNIVDGVGDKTTCVVLMHDTAATKTTAEALPRVIAWFKEQGFRFCTVEQMEERRAKTE